MNRYKHRSSVNGQTAERAVLRPCQVPVEALGLLVTGAQSQVTGLLKWIYYPVIYHGSSAAFYVFFTP
jgi:hypothetical protein